MEPMTTIQKDTLILIHSFITDNGYPPSIQEMATILGLACNAVQGRVEGLEEKGYITKKPRLARSITITDEGLFELG